MKVELRCIYCNGKEIKETELEDNFYCSNCKIKLHISDCSIEVLEE